MRHFIDRRPNPKDRNLGNRQRFLRRAKAMIKKAIDDSVRTRSIADIGKGETVTIPPKGIGEPSFRHSATGGARQHVLSGNKEFSKGDLVPKPPAGDGGAGKSAGVGGGLSEDEFAFALSRDEFLDLFFEDLELPDLVKRDLKETTTFTRRRAGYTITGTPANIDVSRMMRNSFGRRLALKRPKLETVEELSRAIEALRAEPYPGAAAIDRLAALEAELAALERRRRAVPYIDPFDIRYRFLQPHPEPSTKAVMFCLMDVSGSMREREKDLAKRFFVLLHLFLQRRYKRIDIVFIRHTDEAQEVDEETFFFSRETGGTVVSTALDKMREVVRERYRAGEWNIYAAQASDGENLQSDAERCVHLLDHELMPRCQYYAYVEILDQREMEIFRNSAGGTELWRAYGPLAARWPNFAMRRIAQPSDIYPVFRELFAKQPRAA